MAGYWSEGAKRTAGAAAGAVERLGRHLDARKAPKGMLLIHRTSAPAATRIFEEGFRTYIENPYRRISGTATMHPRLDDAFRRLLAARHRESTRHIVLLLPFHALEKLQRTAAEKFGIPEVPDFNALVDAMGGKLPREWIAGTFLPQKGKFVPNRRFNPLHEAEFSNLENALKPYIEGERRRKSILGETPL